MGTRVYKWTECDKQGSACATQGQLWQLQLMVLCENVGPGLPIFLKEAKIPISNMKYTKHFFVLVANMNF